MKTPVKSNLAEGIFGVLLGAGAYLTTGKPTTILWCAAGLLAGIWTQRWYERTKGRSKS